MTLKKNEAVAIVGSNSEVAKWIQEYYEQQNVVTIGLSRKAYSDYKYISLCDIKEMKGIFSRIKDLGVEITSLYYCPGFIGEKSLADLEWETWSEAINVNLNGAFCIYRALIDTLGTASSLKFIVTGSTVVVSRPINNVAYSCAKTALETFVNYINNEKPSHVRACCIRLGRCSTDFAGYGNRSDLITKSDIHKVISLIDESRIEVLPELIALRPIFYL